MNRIKASAKWVLRERYRLTLPAAKVLSRIFRENKPEYDLVFVLEQGFRGWILEAICKEIARYYPGKVAFHYAPYGLPDSKNYFFAHFSLLPKCLKRNPWIWNRKLLIWYTHPKDVGIRERELIYCLNQTTKIVCTCSANLQLLESRGVDPKRLIVILAGADPSLFPSHPRSGKGKVGFCSAYHPRKSPERILEIIQAMPHREFVLIGKRWSRFRCFEQLRSLPNFLYVEPKQYSDYPELYALLDVFVSPSKLEGGPIPLLEAMMSNVVPVASQTGFAPDLIQNGKNGYIFEIDAPVSEICHLIDQAFDLKSDVRTTVEKYTWEHLSKSVQAFLD